mmetsp:Transcript_56073/g.84858  ORF Transcript_56073/g.84858 Transcript_56073/m.84858 type:complete len:278 (-) Transcript_56073:57-890(-)
MMSEICSWILPIHSSVPNWSASLTWRVMIFFMFASSMLSMYPNSSSQIGLRFSLTVFVLRFRYWIFFPSGSPEPVTGEEMTTYGSDLPPMSIAGRSEAEITRISIFPILGGSFGSSGGGRNSRSPPPSGFAVTSVTAASPGSISGKATLGPSSGTSFAYSTAIRILPWRMSLPCSSYQPSVQPFVSSSVATLISTLPIDAALTGPASSTSIRSVSFSSSWTRNSANSFHLGLVELLIVLVVFLSGPSWAKMYGSHVPTASTMPWNTPEPGILRSSPS